MKKDFNLEKRKFVLGGAVAVVILLYLIRLFTLQIMSSDYKKNADSNAFLRQTQNPSRGIIFDRNDNLLVYNQPAYNVTVVMKEVTQLDTLDFCKTLKISRDYFLKRMRDMKDKRMNPGYSPYTPQVFMTQLSAEECGVFQENCLNSLASIYNEEQSVNIIIIQQLMYWVILGKCRRRTLKRTTIMFKEII